MTVCAAPATSLAWRGLQPSAAVFHVGYQKAEQLLAGLTSRIQGSVDAVVGIARSGIVPATIAAQRLGTELHLLQCQRHAPDPLWMGPAPAQGGRVLVVDDIASTGLTLQRVRGFLESVGYSVVTLALYVDPVRCRHRPDIAHETPGFVRFAWDRRETTPDARAQRLHAEMQPPALEVECFGVDMDGVLLPDVRKARYNRDLAVALRMRQRLRPLPHETLPAIDWSRAHIITGRPAMDYDMTRQWLDAHGFAQCPVHCRDAQRHPVTVDGVVAHKIEAATRIGVSQFIESELIQATLIAQGCPTVDVVWWGRKHRIRLGGVAPAGFGHDADQRG